MNNGTKRNQCDGCQAGVPLENRSPQPTTGGWL